MDLASGVAPQVLQRIERALVAVEDVYHNIHEIHQHPFSIVLTLGMPWFLIHFLERELVDRSDDRLHLGI